jgi:DNA-binding MarR family transcriptional regulator
MTAEVVRIRRRNAVLATLETFRRIHPPISLTSIRAFLYVAENPGINVSELAVACDLSDASASRVARALAGRGIERPLPPSLDLLSCVTSVGDPRERLLRLSARGQALAARIELLIAAQTPIAHAPDPVPDQGLVSDTDPASARSTLSRRERPWP